MASDFTVIHAVRQRFGDATADLGELPVEQEAPFVGAAKDFAFACPHVAPGEFAVLHFESLGVTAGQRDGPRNILRINGVDLAGGITPGPQHAVQGNRLPLWKAHTLLVPAHVLQEANVLHIEAVVIPFGPGQTLDNFIIDNMVVVYKTRASTIGGGSIGLP